jgi:PLP dependent protein
LPSVHFGVLSMGMSEDFAIAIQEGSTEIRPGTALFGPRQPR